MKERPVQLSLRGQFMLTCRHEIHRAPRFAVVAGRAPGDRQHRRRETQPHPHHGRRPRLRDHRRERRHELQDARARQAGRYRRALHALLRAAPLHADARAAHDRAIQCPELHQLRKHGPEAHHLRQPAQDRWLRDVHRRQVAARPRRGPAEEVRLRRALPLATHAPPAALRERRLGNQRRREGLHERRIRPRPRQRLRDGLRHTTQGQAVLPLLPDDAHARPLPAHARQQGLEPEGAGRAGEPRPQALRRHGGIHGQTHRQARRSAR